MINYIKSNNEGITIFSEESEKMEKGTVLGFIKRLCINSLFSYEGYLKSCRRVLNLKSLVPVYLSEDEVYFPISRVREYENIFINYAAIKQYHINKSVTILRFANNQILEISIFKRKMERIIENIMIIKKYKTFPKSKCG